MDREGVFDVWSAQGNVWDRWVKPALFAQFQLDEPDVVREETPYRKRAYPWHDIDVRWAPPADDAIVLVDLDGARCIRTGLALMERGYRPIVAINTCTGPGEVIEMASVTDALVEGARFPAAFPADEAAPAAFLFDARRSRSSAPAPGSFDNRWIVYRSDMPSAQALAERRIARAIVAVQGDEPIADDLQFVLHPWQEAGIEILRANVLSARVEPAIIERGSWLRDVFGWPKHPPGLERFPASAFGRIVPEPSHG